MTKKNSDTREGSQAVHSSKGLYKSSRKMYLSWNLSDFVKSYQHLSDILTHFEMTTNQIWLNHVTPIANFENL